MKTHDEGMGDIDIRAWQLFVNEEGNETIQEVNLRRKLPQAFILALAHRLTTQDMAMDQLWAEYCENLNEPPPGMYEVFRDKLYPAAKDLADIRKKLLGRNPGMN